MRPVLPTLLPDELLSGYRSRLLGLNGIDAPAMLSNLLVQRFPMLRHWKSESLIIIAATAHIKGTSVHQVLAEHSWSVLRVRPEMDRLEPEHNNSTAGATAFMPLAADRHTRACRECMQEDLTAEHFAYWHKSHQLPGLVTCPLHGEPLWMANVGGLLPPGPDEVQERIAPFDDGEIKRLISDRRVHTFVDFLDRISQRGGRPPHGATVRGLQHQLRNLGKDPSDPSTAAQLSRIAAEGFGHTWLQCVIGDIALDEAALARRIHQVLWRHSGAVAEHAALIASLIFDTADEALAAIETAVSDTKKSAELSSAPEEEFGLVV